MNNMPDEVYKSQQKINEMLGDKSSQYWDLVKMWLTCAYSYEELDTECQKLFPTPEDAFLHTNFMISLKNRLKVPPNSIHIKSQNKTETSQNQLLFQPVEVNDYIPMKENNTKPILYPDGSVHTQTYSSEELFLPDKSMILGRVLITAWENEIEEVNDVVAEVIVQATQSFLKKILTAILTSNHSYKKFDEFFKYSVGTDVVDPFIQNAVDTSMHYNDEPFVKIYPNIDQEEQMNALISSCKKTVTKKKRVSIEHVYDVLKLNRNIIPNHSVYSLAVGQASFELDNDNDELLNQRAVFNRNYYKRMRMYNE